MEQAREQGREQGRGEVPVGQRLARIEERLAELDALRASVESALVAQASRIETVLAAARRDLAETAIGDHVQAALTRTVADGDDRLAEVRAAVAASAAPVEALAGAVEALDERVRQVVAEAAQDRALLRELLDRLDALPDQHATAVADVRTATTDAVAEVRRAAVEAGDRVLARVQDAAASVEQSAVAVRAAEEVLAEHLAEADRRVAVERMQLTGAFVEQLADGLTRRERKRLARRLEVPTPTEPVPTEPAPTGSPDPVPAAPAPTPVAPEPVPTAVTPEPAPSPAPTSMPASAENATAVVEPPADVAPPGQVQPSRRSRPVRRAASTPGDPAAVRRALASVRGLGPARQSALIDRFGTIEAIRDAPDEDLLAVRGIGPSLLPAIRDAVRAG